MKTIQLNLSRDTQDYIVRVYTWMSLGLGVTGLVSFLVGSSAVISQMILGNTFLFVFILILEIAAVGILASMISRLSVSTARMLFVVYAVLNGITLSFLFTVFTEGSIASTFFITSGTFMFMSLYGYLTKNDLSKIGNIVLMALVGVMIASVVNIFVQNSLLYWITSLAGILIFVILIAVDTQKIKDLAKNEFNDVGKSAILGALTLYLDFINLFLFLLRIFGRRKREW